LLGSTVLEHSYQHSKYFHTNVVLRVMELRIQDTAVCHKWFITREGGSSRATAVIEAGIRHIGVAPRLIGFAGVGLFAVLLFYWAFAASNSHQDTNSQSVLVSTTFATTAARLVEDYGPILTSDQARQLIGSSFALPAFLPDNLALQEIRGQATSSTSEVALIYSSPNLSQLYYDRGSMIVLILRDGSSYYPQPSVGGPVVFKNATVSGHPAWGYDPQSYAPGIGAITWWSNGVHYLVMADLPFSSLVQIARSMNTL